MSSSIINLSGLQGAEDPAHRYDDKHDGVVSILLPHLDSSSDDGPTAANSSWVGRLTSLVADECQFCGCRIDTITPGSSLYETTGRFLPLRTIQLELEQAINYPL